MINIAYAGRVTEATPIATVLVNALDVLLTISGTIGIISLVFAGILYLIAGRAGNYTEQAVAKKAIIISVIGLVIIMSAMITVRVIAQMLTS